MFFIVLPSTISKSYKWNVKKCIKKTCDGLMHAGVLLVFSAAMQMRYEKLHDVCNRYADVMRPESLMQKHMPKKESFIWHVPTGTAICNPVGVGHKALAALLERIREGDMRDATMFQSLRDNFEGANKNFKKSIIVRHPMERLLSIYR